MDLIKPYFMTNEAWYYFTDSGVKLTSEGIKIKKVVESYNNYIKELKKDA